jgi:hypothetical protein
MLKAALPITLGLAAGVGALQACSTSTSGTGPPLDASSTDVGSGGDVGALPDSGVEAGADAERDVVSDSARDTTQEAPGDAGPDALDSAVDAPACTTGLRCNGTCIAAADCRSCPGAPLLCAPRGECVARCTSCADGADAALPIECFTCDPSHQNPLGTCQATDPGSYCLSGNYFGSLDGGAGYHCGCSSGDAGECPGASQVCVVFGSSPVCLTCGEPTPSGSSSLACKQGGTTCNPSTYACN